MNIEQERADFEKWAENTEHRSERNMFERAEFEAALGRGKTYDERDYQMYLLGRRVALQAQVKNDTTLFCDLKTDEEKSTFFLTGRGYETGVIAQAIQHDVAMAYHRCAEYKKELEALQSQDREDAERYRWLRLQRTISDQACVTWNIGHDWIQMDGSELDKAIDHARRVEGDGM